MNLRARARELRERRQATLSEAELIAQTAEQEDRDLTQQEQEEFDRLMAEADGLDVRAARLEAAAEAREAEEAAEARSDAGEGRRNLNIRNAARESGAPSGPTEERDQFRNLGDFVAAVRFGDPRLQHVESRDMAMGSGLHDVTYGPSGGYAVPEQFRDDLLEFATQGSVIRPGAMVIPAGSPPDAPIYIPAIDHTEGRYGGVEVQWIGEGDPKQKTDAELAQVKLEPQELAGHLVVTDKLLRNWAAGDAVIRRLLTGALVAAQDTAFVSSGSGTGQPTAIVGAPGSINVARQNPGEITYEDVAALYARMHFGGTPVWIASQSILPQLLTMRNASPGGDGQLVFQPGVREGVQPQLLGFPVLWNERSPALGSQGDLMFVDRSYYIIKDGSGPFIAASEHVHFTTNKTVIKIFTNVDGKLWPHAPLTQENGYQVSPAVVLDVPSVS